MHFNLNVFPDLQHHDSYFYILKGAEAALGMNFDINDDQKEVRTSSIYNAPEIILHGL